MRWFTKFYITNPERPIITLKGTLNQMGPFNFVFDTGASMTVIEKQTATALAIALGFYNKEDFDTIDKILEENKDKSGLEIVNLLSSVKIRDKSGIFIGARMGRPEKAKLRKLTGSPQVLFPVGKEGGRMRSFQEALESLLLFRIHGLRNVRSQ